MVEKTVVVNLEGGLHARPAMDVVKSAASFQSDIRFMKDGKSANAKSIVGIMKLSVAKGEEVTLSVNGPDEQNAILSLENLLTGGSV